MAAFLAVRPMASGFAAVGTAGSGSPAAQLLDTRHRAYAALGDATRTPLHQARDSGLGRYAVGGLLASIATAAAARRRKAGSRRSRRNATALAAGSSSPGSVGVVLLSAGVGKRMGAKIPKQYLKLLGLEIALHSLNVFLECDVAEIVVVCNEEYRSLFEEHVAARGGSTPPIKFTGGGKERQNSVENGLAEITSEFVAVHDAARPLVTPAEVAKVIADAKKFGAALLAVQTKATIKEAVAGDNEDAMVSTTPDRNLLWEAHTPQVIRSELLREGFRNATKLDLAVTDDVSVVEALGEPVKLTQGEYTNIKVTTPEDIAVAETILRGRGFAAV